MSTLKVFDTWQFATPNSIIYSITCLAGIRVLRSCGNYTFSHCLFALFAMLPLLALGFAVRTVHILKIYLLLAIPAFCLGSMLLGALIEIGQWLDGFASSTPSMSIRRSRPFEDPFTFLLSTIALLALISEFIPVTRSFREFAMWLDLLACATALHTLMEQFQFLSVDWFHLATLFHGNKYARLSTGCVVAKPCSSQ